MAWRMGWDGVMSLRTAGAHSCGSLASEEGQGERRSEEGGGGEESRRTRLQRSCQSVKHVS